MHDEVAGHGHVGGGDLLALEPVILGPVVNECAAVEYVQAGGAHRGWLGPTARPSETQDQAYIQGMDVAHANPRSLNGRTTARDLVWCDKTISGSEGSA